MSPSAASATFLGGVSPPKLPLGSAVDRGFAGASTSAPHADSTT